MASEREKLLARVLEELIIESRNVAAKHGGVATECCDLCWAIIQADRVLNEEVGNGE